jgi:ATPase family protein associated with various cellular activities (AAA)/winged helix domain-containing protein
MTTDELLWTEANQRYLTAALAEVRARLQQQAATDGNAPPDDGPEAGTAFPADMLPPPALETLCAAFGLSPFERQIVLLCAGVELDARFPGLCAAAQGDPARAYPTFSLALAALDDPHWSAVTPAGPLRRWRLIELNPPSGVPLTLSPLRLDERILHYLAGVQHLDERLADLLTHVYPEDELVPSHQALAGDIGDSLVRANGRPPLIQLCGTDGGANRSIAAAACAAVGLHLFALPAEAIPTHPAEREGLLRLWAREATLTTSALYIDATAIDVADPHAVVGVTAFLERVRGVILLATRARWAGMLRPMRTIEIQKPAPDEQRALWQAVLGEAAPRLNGHVTRLATEFNLSATAIQATAREALDGAGPPEALAARLWDAGRAQVRPRLDDLAQRIEPAASWEDLVLPASARQALLEIAAHVRQRATVYDEWGFATKGARGLGISALFAGASGTGKTMAAEVLAGELDLDLYRIDLSQIVNKYIGETEKNLRRVFDAAEDGGAILFFDEADALFGKRSEVKDSHDRYANIEINYLLQRMELYRGLAVLATNMKSALDPAFLRRIRFVINFPFPDATQRAEIWRRIFPAATPTQGLDMARLAQLNVAGGSIRNIALNATFLAADAGEPVQMRHLLQATRSEYAKVEKPLNATEIGGWL